MKFVDMYANTTPLSPPKQTCTNPVWQTPSFANAPFADAVDVGYRESQVIDESTFLPDPVQLSRQLVDDVPEPDPMLPSMWWLCTFLGLTALTALGIRHSRK